MIKVGITGGIGSGKSLICKAFSVLNVPVYYADIAARILTDTNQEIRSELMHLMGSEIYEGCLLNRTLMAERIFRDKDLLFKVNAIIHPRVYNHFMEWCKNYEECPYVLHESAILFESNLYQHLDKIVTIIAPESLRIKRVLTRENMTMAKVKAIIRNQLSENELSGRSDYIIVNNDQQLIIPQILRLHQVFTTKSVSTP